MRQSTLISRFFLSFGSLLVGWGLARLVSFLTTHWSPLRQARALLQQAIPIWLWALFLLAFGLAIVLWSIRKLGAIATSPGTSSPADLVASDGQHLFPSTELSVAQPAPSATALSSLVGNGTTHENSELSRPLPMSNGINGGQEFGNGVDLQRPNEPASIHASSTTLNAPLLEIPKPDGPRIVAIGGGTGMPQLLRGLREYTDNITAIVTVADDGGSSGRLRYMGVLPPGDFRNNIAALSESEDLITRLFQYRFAQNQFGTSAKGSNIQDDKTGLAGHNFGNLFIATMAAVTGSFESGLAESSRVLAVRGRVLPSTLEQITLCAEICRPVQTPPTGVSPTKGGPTANDADARTEWILVEGESEIPEAGGTIQRVFLKPQSPHAYPEAIRAILQADLILAGPGSFFTSIIPNLLVPAVRDAIRASGAPSLYLCNVASQPGETDGYTVSTHMHQLRLHAGDAFTNVLANDAYDFQTSISDNCHWIPLPNEDRQPGVITDTLNGQPIEYRLFTGDLVDEVSPAKHDAHKLAARVMDVYAQLKEEADERN